MHDGNLTVEKTEHWREDCTSCNSNQNDDLITVAKISRSEHIDGYHEYGAG